MSYQFYKMMHYWGFFSTFLAVGALSFAKVTRHSFGKSERRMIMIGHGLGLFALLLGGFGMLAKLQVGTMLPGWVAAKLLIWLVLGLSTLAIKRLSINFSKVLWWSLPFLGTLAGYLAIAKI